MRSMLQGAAVAACMALSAGSAQAVVFTVTYEGQVAPGGYDNTSFFGPGPFVGSNFSLAFTVDTDTPGAVVGLEGANQSRLAGSGAANPTKGVFTIGSKSIAFGDTYGYDLRYDNTLPGGCPFPCQAGMEQFARSTFFDITAGILTSRSISGYGDAYAYFGQFTGRSHGVPPDDATHFFGNFSANEYTFDDNTRVKTQKYDINASLKITSYTVSVAPEPGAWALMILGFGGVGAALRRRSALSLP